MKNTRTTQPARSLVSFLFVVAFVGASDFTLEAAPPTVAAAINQTCPRSGKPVAADSLTWYRGRVVGFCNPHCRDDFAANATERPEDQKFFDLRIDDSPECPTLTDPRRQFDFWLGSWEVTNLHRQADGSWNEGGVARAKISAVLDGDAVLEEWMGQGALALRGFSLRTYDAEQERWEIILNWHSGAAPSGFSMMVGNFANGRGEFFPPTPNPRTRFTFSKARANSCQWEQATSTDGKSWKTDWIMSFRRVGPGSVLSAGNLPVRPPHASVLDKFPEARQLDGLIGEWVGEFRHEMIFDDRDTVVPPKSGSVRRRVASILDGYALLQLTDYTFEPSGGQPVGGKPEEGQSQGSNPSITVLAFHPQQRLWYAVGMSALEADCHWLVSAPGGPSLKFVETPASDNEISQTWLHGVGEVCDRIEWREQGPDRLTSVQLRRVVQESPATTSRPTPVSIPAVSRSTQQQLSSAQSLLALQQVEGATAVVRATLQRDPENPQAHFLLGYMQHLQKEYAAAETSYLIADKSPSMQAMARYNLACLCALQGRIDDAFVYLEGAKTAGFKSWQQVASDPDFANLREDPRYKKYLPAGK